MKNHREREAEGATAEDLRHQEAEWRFQRIGWAAMIVLLAAALAGLLGPGPLSATEEQNADGTLQVRFNRFMHHESRAEIRISMAVRPGQQTARLAVNADFIHGHQIERIEPVPERVVGGSDRMVYVFHVAPDGGPVEVAFHMQPQAFGWLPLVLGLDDGPEIRTRQFLYP